MPEAETRKAREIAVGGDELATVLDGKGRVIGVGNQLAACTTCGAQLRKDVPACS
jgi:hypothetical protein